MSTLTDLSALIGTQLAGGSGSVRTTFGEKEQAFAWCGPVMNAAVSYVNSGVAVNRNFTGVRVDDTAAVGPITDGTQKPITATLVPVSVSLSTFPGVCEIKTSDVVDTANLGAALSEALYGQALRALDNDLVTKVVAAGFDIDAAPSLASIAQAQAQIMVNGGWGDLVILSPTDYAAIVGAPGTGSLGIIAGANDPRESQLSILGAQIVVSTALTAGTAVVLDRAAVTAVEMDSSPVCLVDVHARLNTTDVVIEVIGGTLVNRPDSIAVIADATP